MKKFLTLTLLTGAVMLLAACGKLNLDSNSSSTGGTKTGSYQTTGTVDNSMYQGVIKNGRYQTSSARGLMLQQNNQGDNTFNIRSMESGLQTLAKAQFPTDKYSFEEGQFLSTATVKSWLARKSKSNAEGLNPPSNGKTDPDTRNPIYLQQILEQDFMLPDGNSMKLGGIAIALGMNKVDYYTKTEYGAQYQTEISNEAIKKQGEEMAAKVVSRLRSMGKVPNNIPIVVGIYKNAEQDSLVGGVYVEHATSKSGSDLGSWKKLDQQNEVLPVVDNHKPINTTVANDFSNFTNQVKGFFPTLAGITAQAHYENGNLAGLNITVNTQFYGLTEIQSFTQYISTAANKYLPSGVPIEITIQSTQGTQAFISRNSGDKGFYTHVFGSY
ncbi:CamS family sex pheromone protein [Lacticaseibacillus chiayiensis]|uniref:CamS family sex pheromone protein n=1 Tax=Lacticaseibacillus chiayiensis TaxID=2100821 RepID=UPI001BD06613|nr:CamS family sex pheromone protein [Lacticaseibacillus chiayiensis]QVI35550.1 CamS family sex pheromone protein [Lacticaseibacillus chiayiensis]